MAIISCSVEEKTYQRLQELARDLDRTVSDLAECAIEEAVLEAVRRGKVQ